MPRFPTPGTGAAPRAEPPTQPSTDALEQNPLADKETCLASLARLGVPHRVAPSTRGVERPVILTGALGGVRFVPHWGRRAPLMDCRFALTMHGLAPIFRAAGFDEVRYSSFYCFRKVAGTSLLSRHASGLAVDIHELRGPGGLVANVEKDWRKHFGAPEACHAPFPATPEGRLRQVVCGMEASGLIYLVLTPDSDAAHYNHLHVSGLRSGDRPLRGRVAGARPR